MDPRYVGSFYLICWNWAAHQSTNVFTKNKAQIFSNFYSIGRSLFVCFYLFRILTIFAKLWKAFYLNKKISYLHDLHQLCTSNPKALRILSNHGVVMVKTFLLRPPRDLTKMWFAKLFNDGDLILLYENYLESIQDFLIKLDMKPCMHLVEISIFH